VILAHIMGIPVEESAAQLAPVGAGLVTVVVFAGRARLGRMRRRSPHVIRDTREKHSRLEEEQTLDVQGPLVVEEPRPPVRR
jgi:hypothetical protein